MSTRGFILTMACTVAVASAQGQWYARNELARVQPVFDNTPMELFYGWGADKVVTPRTSLGFEVFGSYSILSTIAGKQQRGWFGPYGISYETRRFVYGGTYRSDFAFSDNSSGHLYMGTVVGVLMARVTGVIGFIDAPNYNYTRPADIGLKERTTARDVAFPLGLRFGYRSGFDGFNVDLYSGFGLNLSADRLPTPSYFNKPISIRSTFFQFGLALVFGS